MQLLLQKEKNSESIHFTQYLPVCILQVSVECKLMKITSCTQSVKISHWWAKLFSLSCMIIFKSKVRIACVFSSALHACSGVSMVSFLFHLLGCHNCVGVSWHIELQPTGRFEVSIRKFWWMETQFCCKVKCCLFYRLQVYVHAIIRGLTHFIFFFPIFIYFFF